MASTKNLTDDGIALSMLAILLTRDEVDLTRKIKDVNNRKIVFELSFFAKTDVLPAHAAFSSHVDGDPLVKIDHNIVRDEQDIDFLRECAEEFYEFFTYNEKLATTSLFGKAFLRNPSFSIAQNPHGFNGEMYQTRLTGMEKVEQGNDAVETYIFRLEPGKSKFNRKAASH